MSYLFRGLIAVTLISMLAACPRVQPVYNVPDTPVFIDSANPRAEIREAIVAGIQYKGWGANEVEDGHFVARIVVRQHVAEIDIHYDDDSYRIDYKDSANLMYDGTRIHRNYNKWIKLLDQAIQSYLPPP